MDRQMGNDRNEIIEMITILIRMDHETYSKYKYIILVCEKDAKTSKFFKSLFKKVEKYRLKFIEVNRCAICDC